MAAPAGTFYPVGLQHARAFKLNEFGFPDCTGTTELTPYEGVEIAAPKTFDITPAKSRDIVHVGNNRRLSQDKLPSIEVSSATLKTSRLDYAMNALLTNTLVKTMGEALFTGFNTSQQGLEPAIALLLYQQGKVDASGARCYGAYHIPSAVAIVDPASMNENASEYTYNVVASAVGHYIHGIGFAALSEGFTEAEMVWGVTFNLPHIVTWLADGTSLEFNFHDDRPAPAVGKIHSVATVAPSTGVVTDVTATITKAVDGITFGSAPDVNTQILCFYEYAG
jgi:hypothetical protein